MTTEQFLITSKQLMNDVDKSIEYDKEREGHLKQISPMTIANDDVNEILIKFYGACDETV